MSPTLAVVLLTFLALAGLAWFARHRPAEAGAPAAGPGAGPGAGGPGEAPGEALAKDPTYLPLGLSVLVLVGALTTEALTAGRLGGGVTPAMWAGRTLVVLGGAWTLWAYRGMGQAYAPTAHHPDPELELIKGGPYRVSRHPQYQGNVLSLVGLLLALDARWTWLALLPFLLAMAWRIRREEAFLRGRFPGYAS